jgi:ribose transport system substrate-binding protein
VLLPLAGVGVVAARFGLDTGLSTWVPSKNKQLFPVNSRRREMISMSPFMRRPALALCALALSASVVTACGSSSDSDSTSTPAAAASATASTPAADSTSGVASAALAKVQDHVSVDAIGPTKPVGKPIPKGKNLVYVNCGAPACTNQGKAFKEAAAVLGWNVTEIQAQPTPQSIQAAFDEVIRRKPDGVASAGFGSALYPRQLAELKKLNIPVFSTTGTDESGTNGITFEPLPPKVASAATAVLADKAISDMGGEGEAGSVLLGGYPIVKDYTAGYTDEIKASCPKCTVKQIEVQPTSIGKDAASKIVNFVRANPKIKTLFLSYDALGSGLTAAAKGAGVTMPKTYSWAPDAPGIQSLQSGERTASVLMPYNELSWQLIDGFAREFTGQGVADSQPLQTLLVVSNDLKNTPKTGDPFPSSVADYQAQFKKLWGVN